MPMLKSGKWTSTVGLHFGIGETTVRDIKKKVTELNRYEITFGSPCSSERKFLKVLILGKKSKSGEKFRKNFKNPEQNILKKNSGARFYPQ